MIRFVPRQVRIVDEAGSPLPAGLPLKALPSNEAGLIGFDGMAEINAGAADTRLEIGTGSGGCVVELVDVRFDAEEIAPLVCARRSIAQTEPLPEAQAPRRLAGKARRARVALNGP